MVGVWGSALDRKVSPHCPLLSGSLILAFGGWFLPHAWLGSVPGHIALPGVTFSSGLSWGPVLTFFPTPSLLRDVSCVSFPGIKLCLPHLVLVLMSMLWFLHRMCPQRGRNLRLQSRDLRPRGLPGRQGHKAGHLYPGSSTAMVVSKLEGGRVAGQGPGSFLDVALKGARRVFLF